LTLAPFVFLPPQFSGLVLPFHICFLSFFLCLFLYRSLARPLSLSRSLPRLPSLFLSLSLSRSLFPSLALYYPLSLSLSLSPYLFSSLPISFPLSLSLYLGLTLSFDFSLSLTLSFFHPPAPSLLFHVLSFSFFLSFHLPLSLSNFKDRNVPNCRHHLLHTFFFSLLLSIFKQKNLSITTTNLQQQTNKNPTKTTLTD